ncbi:MAG: hypothetical protein L0Z48_00395 [candidate division Zixibacteria bacterium]|nr:hypothetical protein [candidate division Zixibacteria bacterium]MCI0594986.1 hypothetical protein [candidate division Zixibacteria bacterium]
MKHYTRWGMVVLSLFVGLVFAAGKLVAQEHPTEHPKAKPAAKPEAKKTEASLTMADLSTAIKGYIAQDAKLKGGYYLVYDPVSKKTLEMTLDRVHEDRLSKVAEGVYFACVDCKATDGKVYDVDIFMKGNKSKLEVNEVSVHKVDGSPRYGWAEEGGVWKKQAAGASK